MMVGPLLCFVSAWVALTQQPGPMTFTVALVLLLAGLVLSP